MDTLITGKAVIDSHLVDDAAIAIEDDSILYAGPRDGLAAALGKHGYEPSDASQTIAHDGYILPGLVDIHNHGGGGVSFPEATEPEAVMPAIAEHRRHGTTSIVASLVTAPQDELLARVRALSYLCDQGELEGIHLEGPFISKERKGAHNPDFIVPGNVEATRELLTASRGHIATMTIAPEMDPEGQVADALIEAGALPSFGHTDCSGLDMTLAVAHARESLTDAAGRVRSATPTATHLFNAMRPIHHRDAGPAFAAIDAAVRGDLVVELIADGVHTAADTVAYTFNIVPADNLMLITDAMAATGMADGSYRLGSLDVNVAGGIATLVQGGAIAGGTAHLLDVVRFAHLNAGVDLARAVHAASQVPAAVLGIADSVGDLREGLLANLVLTSDGLEAERVMFYGEWYDEAEG